MTLIIVLLCSLVVAIAFKRYIKVDAGESFLLSLIFVPALLIIIDRLPISELSGFGLQAKFSSESSREVSTLIKPIQESEVLSLLETDPDFERAAFFEACVEYFVLRPSLVPSMSDNPSEFFQYITNSAYAIRSSIACGALSGVLVIDDDGRYIGSYEAKFFAESLAIWAAPDFGEGEEADQVDIEDLANRLLQQTIFGAALRFPDKRIVPGEGFAAAVNGRLPLRAVLRVFDETNAPFLAVTDARGVLIGVVKYETAQRILLSALMEP